MRYSSFTHAMGLALALTLCVAAGTADAAANGWTVVELTADSPDGGTARDVNNHGDVVGHTFTQTGSLPFGFTPHAYVWKNGVRQDIGSAAGTSSVASQINDRGDIVGQVDGKAFEWNDGIGTSLGVAGSANGINKRGDIVGTYWTGGSVGSGHEVPFLLRNGVFFELPTLGTSGSGVNDINDKGVAPGFSIVPFTSNEHAVLWEDLAIRDINPPDAVESFGNRINNHGVVAGWMLDNTGHRFMVRWNVSGGPAEKLDANFVPAGINDHGDIVGNDVSNGAPFLWEDGTVTNLLELPAMKAGGWQSFAPFAINDHGWIVGNAWKPGIAFFGTALLLIPK